MLCDCDWLVVGQDTDDATSSSKSRYNDPEEDIKVCEGEPKCCVCVNGKKELDRHLEDGHKTSTLMLERGN